ncbi:MAG: YlbG family protein [Candidatus Izimaplasma sp.]|nr:YlbG family protein [Candidatus Izimaplasma bacterium]
MTKRTGLIIYYKTPKVLGRIKRLTDLKYYNKDKKYAVAYVEEKKFDHVYKQLTKLRHVKKVEQSKFDMADYHIDFNVK